MKKSKIILYTLLSGTLVFSWLIFFPRSYNMPQQINRVGTKYWQLPTGSNIGYTMIPAKGNKKPYPIIYLHGGPGGSISDSSISILSSFTEDGYDVYLYDQIGSGLSARLSNIKEYTAQRHVMDLEEIVKQVGTEKVIIIAQSWGAILATLFTADNLEKIDKIIFSCPGPIYPVQQKQSNQQAPDSFHLQPPIFSNAEGNKKINNIRTKSMAYFATWFGKKIASDKEADDFETLLSFEVNKSTVKDTANIAKPRAGNGFYARVMTMNSLSTIQDPRPKLLNSSISVLIMKGQYDNQKWGFTNEYAQVFKSNKLVVIPNAGHSIASEQRVLYLATIREFLAH